MSSSEHDLRHAISYRPSPFQNHLYRTESPGRASSHADTTGPAPTAPDDPPPQWRESSNNHKQATASTEGRSTAYEPLTPNSEAHDPVARHIGGQEGVDIESLPQYWDSDPYQLSPKIKSASEIAEIRANIKANTSRKRQGCASILPHLDIADKWRAHRIGDFYETQNENIERLLKPVDDHVREAKAEHGENQLKFKIAVQGSFVANLILAGLQLYAAISSGSLSLFTTMADALFDPLSNVTLIACNRAVNRVDPRKFPSGKARIETAGNIAFCFLMTTVSIVIIVQSIQELTKGSSSRFNLPSVLAVAAAFGIKFALFCYCWSLRNNYSQIRILWEDHRNDLFVNGFGLLTSVGGSKLKWYIDPAGAIVLSCLIIFLWLRTAWSEFQLLIGLSADPNFLQLLTYICQ